MVYYGGGHIMEGFAKVHGNNDSSLSGFAEVDSRTLDNHHNMQPLRHIVLVSNLATILQNCG